MSSSELRSKEATTRARPSACTDGHLDYLDELRASGQTNMWGATPYLMREFPSLSKAEASEIFFYWMQTFPRNAGETP